MYVYAAIEGRPTPVPAPGMPGGSAPRTVPLDARRSLVVSDVPAAIYGADALEARLADLTWVADAGAAHHAIVDALADQGLVVVPFRLFTLFSNDERAVAALHAKASGLVQAFDRVRDRQEWVLTIGRPNPPARDAVPARPDGARSAGTRFLEAKAAARRERAARAERAAADAADAYRALQRIADLSRLRPVESGGQVLLDAVFLVPPERVDEMRRTLTTSAARLLEDGCAIRLTGPWPPYSFASLDARHDG